MKCSISFLLLLWKTLVIGQTTYEFNAGTKRYGIDLITTQVFSEKSPWSFFSRNRAVRYYDDQRMGFLTVNSLVYSFRSGLGFTGNLIGDNDHFYSSLGIQLEKIPKNGYIYVLATYAFNKKPYQEDYVFLIYNFLLPRGFRIVLHQEYYFSYLSWKNDQSLQRIKLGLGKKSYQFGLINETYQSGADWHSALWNLGLYLKKSF